MIWSNKDKIARRKNWFAVGPPKHDSMKAAMRWCDHYHLSTHYYYHYTNTRWWFEDEQDAFLFALHWSGR